MDRDYDRFKGIIEYLDEKCSVSMFIYGGETTVEAWFESDGMFTGHAIVVEIYRMEILMGLISKGE